MPKKEPGPALHAARLDRWLVLPDGPVAIDDLVAEQDETAGPNHDDVEAAVLATMDGDSNSKTRPVCENGVNENDDEFITPGHPTQLEPEQLSPPLNELPTVGKPVSNKRRGSCVTPLVQSCDHDDTDLEELFEQLGVYTALGKDYKLNVKTH